MTKDLRPDEVAFGPASPAVERIMNMVARSEVARPAPPVTALADTPVLSEAQMRAMVARLDETLPPVSFAAGGWLQGSYDDLVWVRTQLARFTYKPGWSFEANPMGAYVGGLGSVHIRVIMHVEDTYNPGRMIDVNGNLILWSGHEIGNERLFALRLASFLKDMEIHESREWLRRDGQVFDNPHAPGARP